MLRSIPSWKWEEIKIFHELDPDPADRADWGLAHIVQVLMRDGKPLRDYALPFGDNAPTPVVQPVEHQQRIIDAWIFGSNASITRKGK